MDEKITEAPLLHELIVEALNRAHPLGGRWRWSFDSEHGFDTTFVEPWTHDHGPTVEEQRRVCEIADVALAELEGMLPRCLLGELPKHTLAYTARAAALRSRLYGATLMALAEKALGQGTSTL